MQIATARKCRIPQLSLMCHVLVAGMVSLYERSRKCDVPPCGEGLNQPVEVKLLEIFKRDKNGDLVSDDASKAGFKHNLKKYCKKMDAVFVSYDIDKGIWVFRVSGHCHKIGCGCQSSGKLFVMVVSCDLSPFGEINGTHFIQLSFLVIAKRVIRSFHAVANEDSSLLMCCFGRNTGRDNSD